MELTAAERKLNVSVGLRLRRMRILAYASTKAMAKALGISAGTLWNIERGYRPLSLTLANRVSDLLSPPGSSGMTAYLLLESNEEIMPLTVDEWGRGL